MDDDQMKLPDEIATTPYEAVAYRVSHFHDEDDEPSYPGTILIEVAARLPGTEAEITVPIEMPPDMALGLVDELVHQYRCLVDGLPDDDEPDESSK